MSAPQDTREALILAAERLFGEKGVDAVSLRQVNAVASQRNTSAAHYHFGSKQALVTAVYDYRMERINRRRLAMLEAMEREGRARDVRALVEAMIYPMLEEMGTGEEGRHYIRFFSQVASHPSTDVARLARSEHASGIGRIHGLLRACLPELPDALFAVRWALLVTQGIHGLADMAKITAEAARRKAPFSTAAYASNLCDTLAAALRAPVSNDTTRELRSDSRAQA